MSRKERADGHSDDWNHDCYKLRVTAITCPRDSIVLKF